MPSGIRDKHYARVLEAWFRVQDQYIDIKTVIADVQMEDAFRRFMKDYIRLKQIHDEEAIAGPGLTYD